MEQMTAAQWRAFASAGTRTGKIAVHRKDGSPHVTPVWFLLDESDPDDVQVVFTTSRDIVKGKALRRDPRFALCVDDQEPPYSFVLLECRAELIDDLLELESWAIRLAARYMGQERGAEFGARNAVPGEYLVRGRIGKVTAYAGLTD
jgi:PPOX class probable F420-dependent enzyme